MSGFIGWVGSVQQNLDSWARQQKEHVIQQMAPLQPGRWRWGWKWQWQWPWQSARERKEMLEEEYRRHKEQIHKLCSALKAEDATDLRDILSAMILSECVYKRPESEVVRTVNKYTADLGGHLIQLEHVQPSLDHVPHRYLLAESNDTLFASFIGTKQYKDMVTDVNILQRSVFTEDQSAENIQAEDEMESMNGSLEGESGNSQVTLKLGSQSANGKGKKSRQKPAAHRGFLARARGIPAAELYRLAKKKDRRLVLCGHSLGGAVAVLTTLAILKVLGDSSRKDKQVDVKCITFSQPPVGNAALRDYVHDKGWHTHFRTYCIPEDLIPRILSPAYFEHYRMQAQSATDSVVSNSVTGEAAQTSNSTIFGGTSSPIGLQPLQNSLRRISTLVPLVGGPKTLAQSRKTNVDLDNKQTTVGTRGKSVLHAFPNEDLSRAGTQESLPQVKDVRRSTKNEIQNTDAASVTISAPDWRNRVPSLPSYVPFGQLFLLEKSSVEAVSASEYTLLTSMQSVLSELRERFRSHTMRSYRARFQRIYDLCTYDAGSPKLSMEHVPYLPHFQQWLGLPGVTVAELGKIAEPLVLRSATSLVPIGWSGMPGEKKISPFRVDICGHGLHLITLVKAQINGHWCSATVELMPREKNLLDVNHNQLQRMRIRIGQPIQQPKSNNSAEVAPVGQSTQEPKPKTSAEAAPNTVASVLVNGRETEDVSYSSDNIDASFTSRGEDLTEVIIHCSSDFMTTSRKVVMRLRRVRLLGLEGAGKTNLYYALIGQNRATMFNTSDGIFPETDRREGVSEGIAFIDPAGINLQDLPGEVNKLKNELTNVNWEENKKVDLVVLVHNLSHKIPRLHHSEKPALSVLMDEVASAGVRSILAITNKFAVSADRRQPAAATVMKTYQMPPDLSIIVNSSPYVVHGLGGDRDALANEASGLEVDTNKPVKMNGIMQGATRRLISAPINFVQFPFRKKEVVLPVEGVKHLRILIKRILLENEEAALMELCREQLLLETKKDLALSTSQIQKQENGISAASAVGAGLGLIIAVAAAAASSFRKP